MVQRKVPNKLVIQADHVKSNMLLGNLIIKPSSPRGGLDLTKKMKKSRPIKRSPESLRASPAPLRKEAAQLGKPRPVLPQKPKQSPIKSSQLPSSTSLKQSPGKLLLEGSPNYMKSTSSFDARKERSPPRISQAPLVHKTPSPKKSEKPKLGSSASGHKASRTSSFELARTLTKTPSFKPSRASKKCSPVAFCEEFDVQRATCSSTLKGSKFPDYLELDPGGTELEGTSSMKVCPYTYCSLNGHHHAPLPPLKSFLSARRRMIKTQKSFKLGCLSPRHMAPFGDTMKEADDRLVIPPMETAIQQSNLDALEISPPPQEHIDFFIEIYSKDGGDGEIVESPDIDFGTLNGNSDTISIEMDVGEMSPDYWMEGAAEDTYPPLPAQEETKEVPRNLLDQPYFEASDMEWEIKSPEINANNKEVRDEESVGSEAWLEDVDSNVDVFYPHSGSDQFLDLSNSQTSDGLSSTTKETGGNTESLRGEFTEDNTIEGPKPASEDMYLVNNQLAVVVQLGEDESENEGDELTHEVSTGEAIRMDTDQIDATKSVVKIKPSNLLEEFIEADLERDTEDNTIEGPKPASEDMYLVNNQLAVVVQLGEDESENEGDELTHEVSTGEAIRMDTDQIDATKSVVKIKPSNLLEEFIEADLEKDTEDDLSEKQSEIYYDAKIPNSLEKGQEEAKTFKPSYNHHSEYHTESGALGFWEKENSEQAVENMEEECANNLSGENGCSIAKNKSRASPKNSFPRVSNTSDEELLKTSTNLRIIRNKRPDEELEGTREFNPRDPHFLPVEPDLEGEKVDLRHQMMDERKNAEEWMVDFALQQAVTRLATARKKKVSLLVEAFEKVTPIPKYQTHLRQTSRAFEHTRTIQACS